MKRFKKILVLENEAQMYAKNDWINEVLDTSFKDLEVEWWYHFYHDFTGDKEAGMKRFLSISDDTLILSETSFVSGASGGYGDRFGAYVQLFQTFKQMGKKLNAAVICWPELKWFAVDWLSDSDRGRDHQKKHFALLDVFGYHNIFSIKHRDTGEDFYKVAQRITVPWFNKHYFKRDELVNNVDGKKVRIGGFYHKDDFDEPKYNIWIPTGEGNTHTSGNILLTDLLKHNPDRVPVKCTRPKPKKESTRVTKKYLEVFVNKKLSDLKINLEVKEIYATRFTTDQYEGGAARLVINLWDGKVENDLLVRPLYCFYTMGYLQERLQKGDELYLKFKLISNKYIDWEKSELSYRKKEQHEPA